MRKIIDGKRYDTNTAEEVASYSSPHYISDFSHYEESLYRTKKGAWFLAGEGGPMSRYSKSVQGGVGGGSDLVPLSKREALEWLESHSMAEEIEKYFSEEVEEA